MELQVWLLPLLGGAVGAALINWLFGIWKLKADRRDEHQRWLRDKKQEAYVEFFEATRLVLTLAADADTEEKLTILSDKGNEIKGSPIRMLAPEPILKLAKEVHEDVQAFVDAVAGTDPDRREEVMGSIRPDIESKRQQLVKLCGEDLRSGKALA